MFFIVTTYPLLMYKNESNSSQLEYILLNSCKIYFFQSANNFKKAQILFTNSSLNINFIYFFFIDKLIS